MEITVRLSPEAHGLGLSSSLSEEESPPVCLGEHRMSLLPSPRHAGLFPSQGKGLGGDAPPVQSLFHR